MASQKTFLKYDLNGNLKKIYENGLPKSLYLIVYRALKHPKNYANDSFWFVKRGRIKTTINAPEVNRRRRPVLQYNLRGKLIKKYPTLTEASNTTGVSLSNILHVCQGKTQIAGGFYWQYYDGGKVVKDLKRIIVSGKVKSVIKCDIKERPIKRYLSIVDAAKQNKIDSGNIVKVCRGERQSAGSFFWKYNKIK